MVALALGRGAYQRNYSYEPEIHMLNRFYETDPANTIDGTAILARPGTTPLVTTADNGTPRGFFSAPGLYDGDLFFVTGQQLYRYRPDGTKIAIGGEILGAGKPSMAFMSGAGYERLFIADGTLLQYYDGGSKGTSTLTVSGTITNQIIRIGASYFSWSNTVSGPATGILSDPWLAKLGANNAESLQNMANLLSFVGTRGIDFSSNLGGQNPDVTATVDATHLYLTSRSDLSTANSIATTVPSGAGIAFGTATITGAGVHVLHGVEMPDGVGAQSCASLAGFILVSVAQSGRFYWLNPGDITIDPLNFATAERQPDNIVDMISVGDTVWMLGDGSTEVWYATGDAIAPFAPTQGRVYARGIVEGTAVRVKDQVILVGSDGIVYSVGGGIERISHHGIEERIRAQLERELGS